MSPARPQHTRTTGLRVVLAGRSKYKAHTLSTRTDAPATSAASISAATAKRASAAPKALPTSTDDNTCAHGSPTNHDPATFPDDHHTVTFVNRPFPLDEAHEHFSRLRRWGLTFSLFNSPLHVYYPLTFPCSPFPSYLGSSRTRGPVRLLLSFSSTHVQYAHAAFSVGSMTRHISPTCTPSFPSCQNTASWPLSLSIRTSGRVLPAGPVRRGGLWRPSASICARWKTPVPRGSRACVATWPQSVGFGRADTKNLPRRRWRASSRRLIRAYALC